MTAKRDMLAGAASERRGRNPPLEEKRKSIADAALERSSRTANATTGGGVVRPGEKRKSTHRSDLRGEGGRVPGKRNESSGAIAVDDSIDRYADKDDEDDDDLDMAIAASERPLNSEDISKHSTPPPAATTTDFGVRRFPGGNGSNIKNSCKSRRFAIQAHHVHRHRAHMCVLLHSLDVAVFLAVNSQLKGTTVEESVTLIYIYAALREMMRLTLITARRALVIRILNQR
jgi:hypothetical protein